MSDLTAFLAGTALFIVISATCIILQMAYETYKRNKEK
jgi:hypothetical protein